MELKSISEPKPNTKRWILSAVVWCCFFLIFFWCRGIIQSTDSKYVIPSAVSLWKQLNLDVTEFFHHPSGKYHPLDYHLEKIGEGYYNRYPVGQVLMAMPFVMLTSKLAASIGISDSRYFRGLELLIACAIAAGCCVVMYWIADLRLDTPRSLIVTVVFGLGTPIWSTASRGLWQHGPSVLFLSLTLLMLLKAETRPKLVPFIAIPLALSYVMRPLNAVSVVFFTAYVFLIHREHFLAFMLISCIVALPFLSFNMYMYGFPLSPYYTPGTLGIPRHQGEAIAGLLFSPSRGLFFFSPILLFSLYGIALKLNRQCFKTLDFCVLLILASHVAAVAFSNPIWWAGHAFGPRFMTDMTPFLAYFLIPMFQDSHTWTTFKTTVLWSIFTTALVFSCIVHYSGAVSYDAWAWNVKPTNIDRDLDRLWDWDDSQALRALRIWFRR
jgi:hypothetical protein